MAERVISFTPLRQRRVTLVSPSELPPPPQKPAPKTAEDEAAWRRRVKAAFAVVEADPHYHTSVSDHVSLMDDPHPAMEFAVWDYEAFTGKVLLP